MKTNKLFAVLAVGLAVAACGNSGKPQVGNDGRDSSAVAAAPKAETAKDYAPSKSEINTVSYLLGVNYGSFLKGYDFGENLNFNEMVKGMKDFLSAEGNFRSEDFAKQFKVDPNTLNDVFNDYLEKRHNYTRLINREAEDKFLAANAKKAGVQISESGLQYKIIEPGAEYHASMEDTVYVKYTGSLSDGTVFDQTDDEPVSFPLTGVISGFAEGLRLVGEGGKVQLVIPSAIGYGEQGNQVIPANSTLIFDVELVKISKAAEADEQ